MSPDINNSSPPLDAEAQPNPLGHLGLILKPAGGSEQPILTNCTIVQVVPGFVLLDCGFLEPQTLRSIARAEQSAEALPDVVEGRLACRLALSLDTAAGLAQQLGQLLRRNPAQPQQLGGSPASRPTRSAGDTRNLRVR